MKLSFSLASKSQSAVKKPSSTSTAFAGDVEEAKSIEYVTEFDSSKAPVDPTRAKQDRVIPPKANEWRPHKRMKNLELPLQSNSLDQQQPALQFEVDPLSSAEPSSNSMSYGLNLRINSSNNNVDANTETDPSTGANGDLMLHRLREDLKRLPDEDGMDDFADMPVEGFGRALLAGYGWQEGKGIGRNAKEDVKVVEYKRRTAKEGLGFIGELPVSRPKYHRDNGNDNIKKISEKESGRGTGETQIQERGLSVGKEVRIIGGRDMGMIARVMEVKGDGDFAIVRLLKGQVDVTVHVSDIAYLGSMEEERGLRKLKELKIREKNENCDKGSGKDGERVKDSNSRRRESKDRGSKDGRKDSRREKEEIKGSDKVSWLTSHIRVRVISKELKGGRLYLKKGEVVDVVGPATCDISMDESMELIQGVDQELLETALPRRGGPVLVLYGRHKGVYGNLVERDTDKETGVVRDADTHELLDVRLEQIAEYLGDPSYIGY